MPVARYVRIFAALVILAAITDLVLWVGMTRLRPITVVEPANTVTASRLVLLQERIGTYVRECGELPRSLYDLPMVRQNSETARDGWGEEIEYQVAGGEIVMLRSLRKKGDTVRAFLAHRSLSWNLDGVHGLLPKEEFEKILDVARAFKLSTFKQPEFRVEHVASFHIAPSIHWGTNIVEVSVMSPMVVYFTTVENQEQARFGPLYRNTATFVKTNGQWRITKVLSWWNAGM